MRGRGSLPTVNTWPGLELAGVEDGPLDGLTDQIEAIVEAQFNKHVVPKIQAEAAKGAEAAVKPLIMASMAVSGVAIILAIAAIVKK